MAAGLAASAAVDVGVNQANSARGHLVAHPPLVGTYALRAHAGVEEQEIFVLAVGSSGIEAIRIPIRVCT